MRILGIDVGGWSIKAVEIDSAFGRYDIHDYHESPIQPDAMPQEALENFIKGLAKTPDRIVIALKPGQSTFRNLQLPTRNKKAIQSGIGFELEDELPFPQEISLNDYAILSQAKEGTSVHVAATLKHHVQKALEIWKNSEVSPDIITTDGWTYQILLNRVLGPSSQEAPVLLAQIGHLKTSYYLHWKGAPLLLRESSWGGRNLTLAISQKFGIPLEQAESLKLDQGFVSRPESTQSITPEQMDLSQCLEGEMTRLASDLKQIKLVAKTLTEKSIRLIYITGGTSLLPGMSAWIDEKVSIPTQPLSALSALSPSGVTYSHQTDARFLLAASLAYTQVGNNRTRCINFRKGSFSKQVRTREMNLTVLKKPLLAIGMVAACLFLSLIVQSQVTRSKLNSTDVLLERSVRSFFGPLSPGALRTYMTSTSTLRTSINRELVKQRELSKLFGANPKSPLEVLNRISAAVPKDVVTDLILFQAGTPQAEPYSSNDGGASSASLTFLVSNPQMAERLAASLNNRLSQIQRGKMEEVPSLDDSTKRWKINFSGKPLDENGSGS